MQKTWMILPVITLAGLLFSCNIINPPEDIPAYIKIDTLQVVKGLGNEPAYHNLTCVKINVAGTSLGFFEIPTMTPCLTTGLQTLFIEPGFAVNGISASRAVYPFFKPYTGPSKFNLIPGEDIIITPTYSYKPACKFPWEENFEAAGVTFLYGEFSDTIFMTETSQVREGKHSGAIYIDSVRQVFQATSDKDFTLPNTGSMIIMEFDYLSTAMLEFGVYTFLNGIMYWNSLVIVRPINHWNRIYIDLQPFVKSNSSSESFRPEFRAVWDSTGPPNQSIYMDNLKLIHF